MKLTISIGAAFFVLTIATAASAMFGHCDSLADPAARDLCVRDAAQAFVEQADRETAARRERLKREAEAYDQELRIRNLEDRIRELESEAGGRYGY